MLHTIYVYDDNALEESNDQGGSTHRVSIQQNNEVKTTLQKCKCQEKFFKITITPQVWGGGGAYSLATDPASLARCYELE